MLKIIIIGNQEKLMASIVKQTMVSHTDIEPVLVIAENREEAFGLIKMVPVVELTEGCWRGTGARVAILCGDFSFMTAWAEKIVSWICTVDNLPTSLDVEGKHYSILKAKTKFVHNLAITGVSYRSAEECQPLQAVPNCFGLKPSFSPCEPDDFMAKVLLGYARVAYAMHIADKFGVFRPMEEVGLNNFNYQSQSRSD